MNNCTFGDICLCDLSCSLNVRRNHIVPLIYIAKFQATENVGIYCFCRVGPPPKETNADSFVTVIGEHGLRDSSAVYPSQLVYFTDSNGLIAIIGRIQSEETLSFIKKINQSKEIRNGLSLIMSLCPQCRKSFIKNPAIHLKRLDPFSPIESECDFCQVGIGHTYVIFSRQMKRRQKQHE